MNMIRRYLFWPSILLNLLLLIGVFVLVNRMGGWTYAIYRLRHDVAGLYHHRTELFAQLPVRPGAVIFLGDSQTEQCEWQELLYPTSSVVLNRGIVGDYVTGVLARLDEIARHQPTKIFLLVGINDLLFGKTPEDIAPAYRELVATIRKRTPDSELFLLSVLPVNNGIKKVGVENGVIQQLNTQIAQIAKEYAVSFIDLDAELMDADGNLSAKFTEDGIHLNGAGYAMWKRKILIFNDEL